MIVCGKCKAPMASGSSKNSIRKTRQSYAKTMVCPYCFAAAADWQQRDITRHDYAVEAIRKELKKHVKGRVMMRQNRSYPGLEDRGIDTWDVYYDDPNDLRAIGLTIEFGGYTPQGRRIVGGTYGYVRSFTTGEANRK